MSTPFRGRRGAVGWAAGLLAAAAIPGPPPALPAPRPAAPPPAASFQGLGDLPGGELSSVALALSADGRVVAGHSSAAGGDRAFRWTGGELTALETGGGEGYSHTVAHAASADGLVIAGGGFRDGSMRALVWRDGWVRELAAPDPGGGFSDAWGVSADGSVIAGEARIGGEARATVWRDETVWRGTADGRSAADRRGVAGGSAAEPLGAAGDALHVARAVSSDGAVIAGGAGPPGSGRVFRHAGGMTELLPAPRVGVAGAAAHRDLPSAPAGEAAGAAVHDLSADGGTAVGVAPTLWGLEAIRWRAGAALGLGGLDAGHELFSAARGVSGDGSVVVGASDGPAGREAFVWDEERGMRSLRDLLVREHGLDLAGWTLLEATAVSDDGRTIAGYGRNPDGRTEAWIARLPPAGERPPPAAEHRMTLDGFGEPRAVAIDGAGFWYVADAGGDAIRVFDPTGRIVRAVTAAAGEPPRLSRPSAVAVTPGGELVVLDAGNHRVVVYSAAGEPRRAFGGRGGGPGRFDRPRGLAADGERIAVADTGNDRVQVFDLDGRLLWSAGGSGDGPGRLHGPEAVALGEGGEVWVADTWNDRVLRFGAGGEPLGGFGGRGSAPGRLLRPAGLAWHRGELHVVDSGNRRVQVFGPDGEPRRSWGEPARTPREGGGRLHDPLALAIAPGGLAALCEPIEGRCRVFALADPAGLAAPAQPPPAAPADWFGAELSIAGGWLAVTRPDRAAVELFDLEAPGEPRTIGEAGGPGTGAGRFVRPAGLALDPPRRRLIAADPEALRLQVFELGDNLLHADAAGPVPELRFLRAASTAGMLAALRPDLDARPSEPGALAVDPGGAVYLIDAANRAVLRLDERLAPERAIVAAAGEPFDPVGLAVDPGDGRLWILDAAGRVAAFDRDGGSRGGFELPPAADGSRPRPRGIAAGAGGTVWVVDDAPRVLHLDRGGGVIRSFGGPGLGPGGLRRPSAVAADGEGRIVVLDHGNHRVLSFSDAGEPLGAFGGGLYSRPARIGGAAWPLAGEALALPEPGRRRRVATGGPPEPAASAPPAAGGTRLTGPAPAEAVTAGGSFVVRVEPPPAGIPRNELFTLRVSVLDGAGRAPLAEGVELAVDAAMPEHRHGMTTRPRVETAPDGAFLVHGMLLHMPGDWRLRLDVTRAGITERAEIRVDLE